MKFNSDIEIPIDLIPGTALMLFIQHTAFSLIEAMGTSASAEWHLCCIGHEKSYDRLKVEC
jgi:hypothetical protein